MFFWTLLASLMGVVMFGNWHDNTKEQSVFVEPVYQALALQTYQQHITAENAYRRNIAGFVNYLAYQKQEGFPIPQNLEMTVRNTPEEKGIELIGSERTESEVGSGTFIYTEPKPFFERFRYGYKPNAAVKTYLFCLSRENQLPAACQLDETEDNPTVQYIITYRKVPPKYKTAAKMSILKAIAEATNGSRNVGLLDKLDKALAEEKDLDKKVIRPFYQPLGSCYYILSGGKSEAGRTFIPNYILSTLGINDLDNNSYIIALSMMGGFGNLTNLPNPPGYLPGTSCP